MKALLFPLLLLSSVAVDAQQPRQRQPRQPVVPPHMQQHHSAQALDGNITLRINGKTPDGTAIDFAMTGTGPVFVMNQLGENHAIITHQHQIRAVDNGYEVTCSMGVRIRLEISSSGNTVNYEFRDMALNSTILCQPKTPVVIAKSGGNELTLVIEEPVEPRPEVLVPPSGNGNAAREARGAADEAKE